VIDIGGGSTEFIIGRGLNSERLESLKIGCVSFTERFFRDGRLRAEAFAAAETSARAEIEAIAREFGRDRWQEAYASSGTALALAEILEQNGLSSGGITPEGLARLRKRMIGTGHIERLRLAGLKLERAPVLAAGLAIMGAAVTELDVPRINPVGGAMRLGVLYDLLGRTIRRDVRASTVERFVERWRVDRPHAARVAAMARGLYERAARAPRPDSAQAVEWAGLLHELGYTVSHIGFHKHGAYIVGNADMPGFSAQEQQRLAMLVLGCRGGLFKMAALLDDDDFRTALLALRLAVLFHHARIAIDAPRIALAVGSAIRFAVPPRWLKAHPLTAHLLERERGEWAALDHRWTTARGADDGRRPRSAA
jgi:exopolyphosphatase/guanosine-5'-triphosphate,3'-diphosphate pyrophosphatase